MITLDSIHALQGVLALQNNQIPSVFVSTASEYHPGVFVFGYETYVLELSDTSARIGPISLHQEEEESLRRLYAEFAEEDLALAEAGLPEYRRIISEIDGE